MQDADAAVALNLFYSRITEQQESCAAGLSSLAAALPGAVAGLQDYEAVHRVADETASAARAAHQQVLEAQVHMTLLTADASALQTWHDFISQYSDSIQRRLQSNCAAAHMPAVDM